MATRSEGISTGTDATEERQRLNSMSAETTLVERPLQRQDLVLLDITRVLISLEIQLLQFTKDFFGKVKSLLINKSALEVVPFELREIGLLLDEWQGYIHHAPSLSEYLRSRTLTPLWAVAPIMMSNVLNIKHAQTASIAITFSRDISREAVEYFALLLLAAKQGALDNETVNVAKEKYYWMVKINAMQKLNEGSLLDQALHPNLAIPALSELSEKLDAVMAPTKSPHNSSQDQSISTIWLGLLATLVINPPILYIFVTKAPHKWDAWTGAGLWYLLQGCAIASFTLVIHCLSLNALAEPNTLWLPPALGATVMYVLAPLLYIVGASQWSLYCVNIAAMVQCWMVMQLMKRVKSGSKIRRA